MQAFASHLTGRGSRNQNWVPLIAFLCLVLLALLAVAQVAHLHSSSADADHCPLCILMHTAAPVAAAAALIVIVPLGVSFAQADPVLLRRQRYFHLYIRPPPVSF